MTRTAFDPELNKFNRTVFGPSTVLKIPNSSISNGEKIPGAKTSKTEILHDSYKVQEPCFIEDAA